MAVAGAYVTVPGGGGAVTGLAPELSSDELAAVEEAAVHGTCVAAHAHGRQGIVNAALAGARSIGHGSLLDAEAADLLAERGTYLVADIYNRGLHRRRAARLAGPGGRRRPGRLADVPFVMQGGEVLKGDGRNSRAPLSGGGPYFRE